MTDQSTLRATQQFFGSRAAGWEERFPDDAPQYARAVAELALTPGPTALDLGCGTGRALAPLRAAVGPSGRVIGLDATYKMLTTAHHHGRSQVGALVLGDVLQLPFATTCADAVFAGGLLPHLADPAVALCEMARVTRPGGKLAIFHPIGRVALAARHQRVPSDDDTVAPERLAILCAATGWELAWIDDAEDRYLALALRQ
jgi:SAM-dependent methyltransferase